MTASHAWSNPTRLERLKLFARDGGIIGAVLGLALYLGWVGYLGSDDAAYIGTAEAWLSTFPYVPESHWAVRHTLTLPLAATFSILGEGELQSTIPTLLYGLGVLVLVYARVGLTFGHATGLLAATLLALTPLMGETMTTAGIGMVEAFFVFASLWCFLAAAARRGSANWLIAAGLCAGLAFLSRETAVALVVFYGVSFVVRPLFPRWRYVIMAVGFWLPVGAEML